MGAAVIVVMVIATAVTFPLQIFLLDAYNLGYLQTIIFILVIAVLVQLIEIFDGTIVSVSKGEIGVEIAGRSDRLDNFIEMVRDFGIVEMARSGRVAINRCKKI